MENNKQISVDCIELDLISTDEYNREWAWEEVSRKYKNKIAQKKQNSQQQISGQDSQQKASQESVSALEQIKSAITFICYWSILVVQTVFILTAI